ncbi:MAG: amidohydrolase family protein [Clostridiales bacterium]|nr:amidohydrolase family protein [Clostridiales bacterium]MDD7259583.1 amidohydrolase family protein [Eubacteriales bacterium]MDY6066275.1 amidohydrolase family protein [Candidatus Faecousia sp.]
MDTLITNVTAVTMTPGTEVLFGVNIGITDGKIEFISKKVPEEMPKTIIEGTGMVAMPGLINCHTHLATSVLRCFTDDLTNKEALEALLQKEAKMDSRSAKAAALLSIAECLRFGVTSVSDLYYYPNATAQAVAESGIKANLALSSYRYIDQNEEFDFETDEQCRELQKVVDKWHGYDNGRIKIDAGIFAEYTSNYPLWESLAGYASEKGLGMQLHLSETRNEVDSCLDRTGMTPGELLACHRLFAVPATASGCAFLEPEEAKMLGKKKVSAVALPLSAAKNGQPCAPITDLVKAGMNVALGTDGAIQAGNLDMFEVMRGAAMSVRAAKGDPSALPSSAALMMATFCGAQAQGRAQECGMLKEGMDADLVLVDFTAPHLMPCHNVLTGLVYAAKGGDVAMTMVRGKILYQNGRFPTINLNAVVEELTTYAIPKLFAKEENDVE